jgi:hypothetical protein
MCDDKCFCLLFFGTPLHDSGSRVPRSLFGIYTLKNGPLVKDCENGASCIQLLNCYIPVRLPREECI